MSKIDFDMRTIADELVVAEGELHAWATGQRSYTNEQMRVENGVEERGETLVRIAQRDAAELDLATKKVLALRILKASA